MPRVTNRKALGAGVLLIIMFLLLAPKTPFTAWLLSNGLSREVIDYTSEATGLAGLILIFLAFTHIRLEQDSGEPRLSISLPVWLIYAVLGALAFQGLTRVSRWILGPQATQTTILALTALMLFLLSTATALAVSRKTRRQAKIKVVYLLIGKLGQNGNSNNEK